MSNIKVKQKSNNDVFKSDNKLYIYRDEESKWNNPVSDSISIVDTPIYINRKMVDNVSINEYTSKRYLYKLFKKLIDLFICFSATFILMPLFLVTAIAIKLEDGGPIFFTQIRLGKYEKPFIIYKFRSMCVDAESKLKQLYEKNERDGPVFKIKNDPRITKTGCILRKFCIDELPQIFNIIKGDMTIVGPRPPLKSEVDQYTAYQKKRLNVSPGLTCYWQINKNKQISFTEWVEMDLKYIRECNVLIDLLIILKTIKIIIMRYGES